MIGRETISHVGIYALVLTILMIAHPAMAFVGEPMGALPGGPHGTFGIRVSQGGVDLINNQNVQFPDDIKIPPDDGDQEDYVLIDTWDVGLTTETQIILKVVSEDDRNHPGNPMVEFRTTHWYIDSIQPGDIHTAGAISLFNPANAGRIEVEISNIAFASTTEASPMVLNNDGYYTSFMRNRPGHFYNFADAGTFNQNFMGLIDVQVRGDTFRDGTVNDYYFPAYTPPSNVVSWTWSGLINPGPLGTTVTDEFGHVHASDGFVHELGMAVSFVGVPEPATGIFILLSPLALWRRRRG